MMKLIGNLALVELGDIFRADESERVRTLGGFVGKCGRGFGEGNWVTVY